MEQDRRLKDFPDFWGFLEIRGDALFLLARVSEAQIFHSRALYNVREDNELSKEKRTDTIKRLKRKCVKINEVYD